MGKEEKLKLTWVCIGHNKYGAVWGLGKEDNGKLYKLSAIISRCSDGSWRWTLMKYPTNLEKYIIKKEGISVSREYAKKDVEKLLEDLND